MSYLHILFPEESIFDKFVYIIEKYYTYPNMCIMKVYSNINQMVLIAYDKYYFCIYLVDLNKIDMVRKWNM